MVDKIEQLLKSNDIEMARLGAKLLSSVLPKEEWEEVMERCTKIEVRYVGGSIVTQKYLYIIDNSEVFIPGNEYKETNIFE